MIRSLKWLFSFAVACLWIAVSAQAATFTVSPTSFSNTYAGAITIQVAGLNTGETVVIQKFGDANTNGVIDATDWLVQQFQLTDGQASTIAGVTNISVPGDGEPTAGTITASMSFLAAGLPQQLIGKYAYKLSSPTGRFAPITNFFTITNFAFAQSISGSIRASGTNVPNAGLLLFSLSGGKDMGNPVAGVVANNSGNYTIKAPPGPYRLLAFKSNFVADLSMAPVINLNAGAAMTTNVTLVPATRTISGKARDMENTSIGLPGILLAWESTNYLIAIGFTDTNGSFSVPVTSSLWEFGGDSSCLDFHGYLDLNDESRPSVNTGAGNVAGVNIGFPRGTSLLYGSVKDDQNRPLAGVSLFGNNGDGSGQYSGDATTDENGNYAMAVNAGMWRAELDIQNSPGLANYVFTSASESFVNDGQAVQMNFIGKLANNQITGYVKDNNNTPISGVGVWASATIGGVTYQAASVDTDNTGYYSIPVANGAWTVGLNTYGGDDSLSNVGNFACPDNRSVNISNNNSAANFAVLTVPFQISGYVKDTANNPIPYVSVYAYATLNGTLYNVGAQTDGSGHYTLNVANGGWTVGVSCGGMSPTLSDLGYQCVSDKSVTIFNGNGAANFTAQFANQLQISTSWLPDGMQGSYYNQQLQASGGQQPYSWWLPGGTVTLPIGMNLSTNGVLSGTPGSSGAYNVQVGVLDNQGHSAQVNLSLVINGLAPLQVTTSFLPSGTVGSGFTSTLTASGGQPPYRWTLAPGSANLPLNLVMTTNGVISGIPTVHGTFYFYARVTDAGATTSDQFLPLTINTPPLFVTTASLAAGTVGSAYTNQLNASGGEPPYSWALALGSSPLPPGLLLPATGVLCGNPTTNGTFNFIVTVTDAFYSSKNQALQLTIISPPTLSAPTRLSNSQFQMRLNGIEGQNYTLQYSLTQTGWIPLLVTNAPSGSFTITDSNATNNYRFYRVLVGP